MVEGKVWCCEQEIGGKLAHPPSFTLIVLALLSRRCRVTDRWVRADTCFWRSLIFKCSSCVNTNTWVNQLAVCTWCEWHATLYLPIRLCVPPCLVVSVALLLSYCQIHCHVWMIKNQPGRKKKKKNTLATYTKKMVLIVETKCLFLFELWVRLISVLLKMYSLVKPSHSSFFISHCSVFIFSMVSPSLCVSSLYFIGMGCASLSLSLFVQYVSPFIFFLSLSLVRFSFQKSGTESRQESACWFFDTLFLS